MARHRGERFSALGRHLVEGSVAGLPAGLVMAAWFSFARGARGMGNLSLLRAIPQALGLNGVGWGLVVHLVVSVLFGALFSWLIRPRVHAANLLAWSTFYGVGLFVVMVYLVLPLVHPALYAMLYPQPWSFFLAHLVYGGVLGFCLAAWRTRRSWQPMLKRRAEVRSRG